MRAKPNTGIGLHAARQGVVMSHYPAIFFLVTTHAGRPCDDVAVGQFSQGALDPPFSVFVVRLFKAVAMLDDVVRFAKDKTLPGRVFAGQEIEIAGDLAQGSPVMVGHAAGLLRLKLVVYFAEAASEAAAEGFHFRFPCKREPGSLSETGQRKRTQAQRDSGTLQACRMSIILVALIFVSIVFPFDLPCKKVAVVKYAAPLVNERLFEAVLPAFEFLILCCCTRSGSHTARPVLRGRGLQVSCFFTLYSTSTDSCFVTQR
jgi:hypothetical protein